MHTDIPASADDPSSQNKLFCSEQSPDSSLSPRTEVGLVMIGKDTNFNIKLATLPRCQDLLDKYYSSIGNNPIDPPLLGIGRRRIRLSPSTCWRISVRISARVPAVQFRGSDNSFLSGHRTPSSLNNNRALGSPTTTSKRARNCSSIRYYSVSKIGSDRLSYLSGYRAEFPRITYLTRYQSPLLKLHN